MCISQIALKSIHPMFFEAAIINKFCSKEMLQLVLDMIDQYDNYVMYAFFNTEFFIDLYAKLKGEGYYHEKMKSFFNETIDEILRMIYIENINKLKFYQFITYISKFDMTFVEKITEKLTKDISKKSKSSLHSRMKDGLYVSGRCPFGYQKDPINKNHLVINEEQAEVVKLIFDLALKGNSYHYIAQYLTNRKIKTIRASF